MESTVFAIRISGLGRSLVAIGPKPVRSQRFTHASSVASPANGPSRTFPWPEQRWTTGRMDENDTAGLDRRSCDPCSVIDVEPAVTLAGIVPKTFSRLRGHSMMSTPI